jgi:hypothetical protein
MTPLFACFPVCLTFVALGILALLVVVTGMVGPGPGADADPPDPAPDREPQPGDPPTGPPPWWVVVLIFAAVALAFLSLEWIGADWRPPGR